MSESKLVISVANGISAPGRLLCNRLASAGHTLFAGYQSSQSENIDYEASVTPLALDISSDNSVAAAITQITRATQRIDIVINNMRTALFGALEAVHICGDENFINEMLIGTVRLQNAVLRLMRAQGCGRVTKLRQRLLALCWFVGFCDNERQAKEHHHHPQRMVKCNKGDIKAKNQRQQSDLI